MRMISALLFAVASAMLCASGALAQSDAAAPADTTETADTAPAPDAALSAEELEQLVAPIALYPDQLLADVLMASTYPLEIIEADRWAKKNKSLKGEKLIAAVDKEDWDQSVKSLAATPSVLAMMSEQLEWTRKLGDTMLAQQAKPYGRRPASPLEGAGSGPAQDDQGADRHRRRAAGDHERACGERLGRRRRPAPAPHRDHHRAGGAGDRLRPLL